MRWWTQHNGLLELDPPYVYHIVRAFSPPRLPRLRGSASAGLTVPVLIFSQPEHDEEALTAAIKQAMRSPIERMVLPRMRKAAVQERVEKWVDGVDWWRKWQATSGGSWGDLVGQGPVEGAN